jgi:hypothetical protein
MTVLDPATWGALRQAHIARAEQWTRPHLERRVAGVAHPVMDFLFEYYPYSAGRLTTWHAGAGVALTGDVPEEFRRRPYVSDNNTWTVDIEEIDHARLTLVLRLLAGTASRPAQLNCFGLHEWAMVYRTPDTRHSIPLRLTADALAATVEDIGLRCTHIDAYRFFTPDATPLNAHVPTRETQPDLEQPGCLHATMDLYKYVMWFQPYVHGDLVLDCFALAVDTRVLDMQASPYDLMDLGYRPVRIETPEGRREYVGRQRELTERGAALRARLAAQLDALRTHTCV